MKKEFELFTISQAAVLIKNNKCLIGEFAFNPGFWGLPGGRIDKKEDSVSAFKRELEEEINLHEFEIIELVDFKVWYNKHNIPRCSAIFLINADIKDIKAGDEFSRIEWVSENDLDKFNFVWEHSGQAIRKAFEIFNKHSLN